MAEAILPEEEEMEEAEFIPEEEEMEEAEFIPEGNTLNRECDYSGV